MKKAHAAGQSFHMKPEVHLYKEKVHKDYKSPRSPLKGGLHKPGHKGGLPKSHHPKL